MKNILVIAKRGSRAAETLAHELKGRFPQLNFLGEKHLASALGWELIESAEELSRRAELVIVLGGDGTLIHAARLLHGRPVPVMGVNLGSLGFLTEVPVSETYTMLEKVLAGEVELSARMKLVCRLFRGGQRVLEDEVLNDVVINKGALARISDQECLIDGRFVTLFKADGLIISTPTGSTAYALSAGGPIMHPTVDGVILAPICPHALTQRPLVVPGDAHITVNLKTEVSDLFLTLDGQSGFSLQTGDRLEVCRAANRVQLVKNPTVDYFAVLRQKLRWGER